MDDKKNLQNQNQKPQKSGHFSWNDPTGRQSSEKEKSSFGRDADQGRNTPGRNEGGIGDQYAPSGSRPPYGTE